MTCEDLAPLLDCYADGELEPACHNTVTSHLESCPACAAKVAAIKELGESVRSMSVPAPPDDLWDHIASQVAVVPVARRVRPWRQPAFLRVAAVAALVLIAIYTGWQAYSPGTPPVPNAWPAMVDLAPILENGIPVTFNAGDEFKFASAPLDQAKQQVTFRVFDKPQLTEGFTAKQCQVGCCGMHSIVQTEYRRDQDRCVMFQHSRDLPVGFGNASVETIQLGEWSLKVVEGKACWAASWHINGTAVTIVGPRDRAELLRMVAKVEQSLEEKRP